MEFEWDEAKHAKTLRERGIGFDDGARIFARRVLIWEDARRDYGEDRFRVVGATDGDILPVAFTWRGGVVRIISVRRASRKEAELWLSQMTADEISAHPSKRNRAKIEATTEADIRRQMIEDGENPDEELSEEDIISPPYIRRRLGMSQREFAGTLGVPIATLRNWEQNRVAMEPATIALMRILAREPEAALRAPRRRVA